MELPTTDDIVARIEAFIERHAMSASRFGAEATGDQNLVPDLRRGLSPRLERLHRIVDYMARKDAELVHAQPDTAMAAQHHG